MILHALTQYYQRKAKSDSANIAPEGFEYKEIPFVIVIDEQGQFVQLEDTREQVGKKKMGKQFLVPKSIGRSGKKSYEVSNILYDHYGYVLAHPKEVDGTNKKTPEQIANEKAENQLLAQNQHQSFINKVNEIQAALPDDKGVLAVANFFRQPEQISAVMQSTNWQECQKIKGCNLTFRLATEARDLVCQSQVVQNYLKDSKETVSDSKQGVCLVTGKIAPIARLHDAIKGVNAKPAPFASVNLAAFEAYGKEQGFVFPVSEQAMFEYTTALNTLLASDNRLRIGDVTAVCWSEKSTPIETKLPIMLNGVKDNPDAHIEAVKSLYKSVYNGKYHDDDGNTRFYLLGLSPNSARIVVRFWHETTVAELSINIAQWYDDLKMVRGENSPYPEFMPLQRLLGNLVLDGKLEQLPPDIIAGLTQSALNNKVISINVLQQALRRNRAEQKITYGRACLIKAYINRAIRSGSLKNIKELNMSLDKSREDIGYLLGRLFAVLEKIQDEANPNLNATIGDRYFGSASSTPIAVFGTLIRLSKHHLAKIPDKYTKGVYRTKRDYEELQQEILAKIDRFPSHLNINEQGLFAIGYYHQKQDFYTKSTEN